jgi:hypothetical protein
MDRLTVDFDYWVRAEWACDLSADGTDIGVGGECVGGDSESV